MASSGLLYFASGGVEGTAAEGAVAGAGGVFCAKEAEATDPTQTRQIVAMGKRTILSHSAYPDRRHGTESFIQASYRNKN